MKSFLLHFLNLQSLDYELNPLKLEELPAASDAIITLGIKVRKKRIFEI